MEERKANSVADFKARYEDGVVVRLPQSGLQVRMRSIGLGLLLKRGKIPDVLMGVVLKALAVFPEDEITPKIPPDPKEQALAYVNLVDDVVRESLVEPLVKGGPLPGSDKGIDVDWLEDEDKMYIYTVLNVPLADLAEHSFRQINAESVEPIQPE